jgi:hypothetical protein
VKFCRTLTLLLAFLGTVGTAVGAELPPWSGGLQVGPLMGRTDDTDEVSFAATLFGRHAVKEHVEAEAHVGYGRLSGADFATDLALLGAGVVYTLPERSGWLPLARLGLAGVRHDIATFPPGRSPNNDAIGWTAGLLSWHRRPTRPEPHHGP